MAGLVVPQGRIVPVASKSSTSRPVTLDMRRFAHGGQHVSEHPDWNDTLQTASDLHSLMLEGQSDLLKDGSVVMTGWKTESPFISNADLDKIASHARQFASLIDDFLPDGIGGSYLGTEAVINAVMGDHKLTNLLSRIERGDVPRTFFMGQNMDPDYTATVLRIVEGRRVGTSVASKSGGTVEPAIAFAIIRFSIEAGDTAEVAANRIVAITDAVRGKLRPLADEKGYASYIVPDNVGGRYSVTTPVGLFPVSVAGVDIHSFIAGTRFAEEMTQQTPPEKNIAMIFAAARYIAHKRWGIATELASTGTSDLIGTTMWYQQLGPESEGKNGEGMLIVPQFFTREAHADGQLIQQGPRNLMETFLMVGEPKRDVIIPGKGTPVEYLDGKGLNFANRAFVEGLRDAHYEGGVPVSVFEMPQLNAYTLGALMQYQMNIIALSALLLGQNPFIQPGVQQYKEVANARSGKPGTEEALKKMQEADAALDNKWII